MVEVNIEISGNANLKSALRPEHAFTWNINSHARRLSGIISHHPRSYFNFGNAVRSGTLSQASQIHAPSWSSSSSMTPVTLWWLLNSLPTLSCRLALGTRCQPAAYPDGKWNGTRLQPRNPRYRVNSYRILH
jgi:hypothetical protein